MVPWETLDVRSAELLRSRFIERLDNAVRRPGMFSPVVGLDGFFQGLLHDLAFLDQSEEELQTAVEEVIERRGLRSSVGMSGPIGDLLGQEGISPVIGSIWAQVGWRLGWIE